MGKNWLEEDEIRAVVGEEDWKVGWQESKEGRKKEMTMMATETAWDTGCF